MERMEAMYEYEAYFYGEGRERKTVEAFEKIIRRYCIEKAVQSVAQENAIQSLFAKYPKNLEYVKGMDVTYKECQKEYMPMMSNLMAKKDEFYNWMMERVKNEFEDNRVTANNEVLKENPVFLERFDRLEKDARLRRAVFLQPQIADLDRIIELLYQDDLYKSSLRTGRVSPTRL